MASLGKKTKVSQDKNLEVNKVGALLQASRLRLGHDLRFVSKTLHIRFVYLEAIEAGRYEELPGAVYVIGFIRSYAEFLGLDSEEIVRRSKAEIALQSVTPELVFPVPMPETSVPGTAIVLVGVIVALLAYGAWYASTINVGLLSKAIPPVPERLREEGKVTEPEAKPEPVVAEQVKELVSKVAQSDTPAAQEVVKSIQKLDEIEDKPALVDQSDDNVVENRVKEVPETAPAPVQVAGEVKPTLKKIKQEITTPKVKLAVVEEPARKPVVEPKPTLKPAPPKQVANTPESEVVEDEGSNQAQPPPPPPPQTPAETEVAIENKIYGAENEASKILVRARRNSWIQVRDNKANKLLLTQLLKAGDSYRVPNRSDLILLTGNAGALEILVDGKSVPDLAPPGTILKNITLDPDKLRQGIAAR
jgi:cytoskeleton protein RodZ